MDIETDTFDEVITISRPRPSSPGAPSASDRPTRELPVLAKPEPRVAHPRLVPRGRTTGRTSVAVYRASDDDVTTTRRIPMPPMPVTPAC